MNKSLTVLSFSFLAFLWAVTVLSITQLPERIPIHFNLHNQADDFGSKTTLWLLPIIASILVGMMSVVKKQPKYLNRPFTITDANRERQTNLTLGLLSSIACVIPLLFTFIIYSTIQYVEHGKFNFPIMLVLAAVFVPIGVYFSLAYRSR